MFIEYLFKTLMTSSEKFMDKMNCSREQLKKDELFTWNSLITPIHLPSFLLWPT
jgi:hypothetical protein